MRNCNPKTAVLCCLTSSSSLSLIFCIPRHTLLRWRGCPIPSISCRSLSLSRNEIIDVFMREKSMGRGANYSPCLGIQLWSLIARYAWRYFPKEGAKDVRPYLDHSFVKQH